MNLKQISAQVEGKLSEIFAEEQSSGLPAREDMSIFSPILLLLLLPIFPPPSCCPPTPPFLPPPFLSISLIPRLLFCMQHVEIYPRSETVLPSSHFIPSLSSLLQGTLSPMPP